MNNSNESDNMDWKKTLRSELIKAIVGNPQEKKDAIAQIGHYYMCYAPTFLYKYYSDRPEKLESVKAGKMWYSAPCNFNDVFDCDLTIDENGILNSAIHMIPDKRGIRKGSPMWRQLRQTLNMQIRSFQTTVEKLRSTTGVLCLSESNDSLLMWAHYANNHSGMCVEYELLGINRQLSFSPVPVIYSNERACFHSIDSNTIKNDSMGVFFESLTSKSPEWSYEREWRIIRDDGACGTNWNVEKRGALLNMICPTSIILGCMAKPEFEKVVYEYCEEFKINLYKMEKDKNLYHLNKIPILEFNG